MNKTTHILSIIIILLVITNSTSTIPKNKFVQINPTALNIMINAFDQVLVYFHNETSQAEFQNFLKNYQKQLLIINEKYPQDHSIFGFINITSDERKDLNLEKFQNKIGFKLFNGFDHFELNQQSLVQFYEKYTHPKLQLGYQNQIHKEFLEKDKYYLIFPFKDLQELGRYNSIYQKMLKHITQFNVESFASPYISHKSIAILYKNNQKINQYSLYNRTIQQSATEIIQSLNIDTLPVFIELNQQNFPRVFGGSVQDQILFIRHTQNQQIKQSLKQFEKAALYNRFQCLAYQRVLFASLSADFFKQNFNQDISNYHPDKDSLFSIIFTQTNYGRFQLKKYIFNLSKDPLDYQDIIRFIENIRLKKQEAHYKSEAIPREQQQSNILRKLVGDSFISEVFQKPQQSIIILFYDSKDQNSYLQIKRHLQQFANKYKQVINQKLILADFDLAKNQHKLIYFKSAPQILLFDKHNKKQSKYFKHTQKITYQQIQQWIIDQVSNVNFGDKQNNIESKEL